MYSPWKFLLIVALFSFAASAAEPSRLPGGVCVSFSGNTIVQAPEELKKVRIPTSAYVQTLKDCDYRSAISAFLVGSNGDMVDSCSIFGLVKYSADQCSHGDLTPAEVEKIFYSTYFQALKDFQWCSFKNHGATPTMANPISFTRDDMDEQCSGGVPPEIPDVAPAHAPMVSAAVGGEAQAAK